MKNMLRHLRKKNFYLMLLSDGLAIFVSLYLAYAVRFDFLIPLKHLEMMYGLIPGILLTKLCLFSLFRLYRGMWRYTGLEDLLNVLKATVLSTLCLIFFLLMFSRFQNYSRSIFLIDWGFTFLFAGGLRLGIRMYFSQHVKRQFLPFWERQGAEKKRLLIIGAGDSGEKLVREILESPQLEFLPLGFLDDDPATHGKTIHGIRVLGGIEQLNSLHDLYDEIVVATTSLTGGHMRRIITACQQSGKRFRLVPTMHHLISGNLSMKLERRITIQDVLGREEISLDKGEIAKYLGRKRVLITGAGGSIGSELVRQIREFHPEALVLLDMGEFNLFQISMECVRKHHDFTITDFLADIRDRKSLEHVFQNFRPEVIFHAAAYKHVPIQERFPWEAVRNNILGTRNLIETACRHQVQKFVLVSSDKAVRPSSVMGATKRVAEKLIASANHRSDCQFMAVRFGNVIGSSGSVIPLFQEQIERGGPVTVTHPEIFRYFMSIPEAAQLILQAGSMGQGGEIFILEMGKAIRIADLAKGLIRLYGYEEGKDINIRYTGLRPGEKLYEELYSEEEHLLKTSHTGIMVLQSSPEKWPILQEHIEELLQNAQNHDASKIQQTLQKIVPEYYPHMMEEV